MGNFNGKVYAVPKEYDAHVAIFCDNTELAKKYVEDLCFFEYDGQRQTLGAPGSGKSTEKAIIIDGYGSVKYNVYFHIVDARKALRPDRELNNLIKSCTGAVILYNVLDPTLAPILKSKTHYKENIELLLPIDTPLNNCIKYLQSFGRYGWWNALNFIMYNKEGLTPELQSQYREQLNLYTLGVEKFYVSGDNKWNRNHPAWNTDVGVTSTLGWISGEIYRSIFLERYLTGAPKLISKKIYSSSENNDIDEEETSEELSEENQKEKDTSEWKEILKWFETDNHGLRTTLIKAYKMGIKPKDLRLVLERLMQNCENFNEIEDMDMCGIC